MKTEIENAIKLLTERVVSTVASADEALKLTQAALNLAHAAQVLKQTLKQ